MAWNWYGYEVSDEHEELWVCFLLKLGGHFLFRGVEWLCEWPWECEFDGQVCLPKYEDGGASHGSQTIF